MLMIPISKMTSVLFLRTRCLFLKSRILRRSISADLWKRQLCYRFPSSSIFATKYHFESLKRSSFLWFLIPGTILAALVDILSANEEMVRIPSIDQQMSYSTQQFFYAALSNNPRDIKRLIGLGMDPNLRHPLGWTALHVAAFHGNVEAVTALLESGADINAIDEFVHFDHYVMYRRLRRQNIEHQEFDIFHSRHGYFSAGEVTWRKLWDLGSIKTFRGMTALHYAVLMERKHVIRVLMDYGANPVIENEAGFYPDDYASDDATRKTLMDYTVQLNLQDKRRSLLENHVVPLKALLLLLRRVSRSISPPRYYVGVDDEVEPLNRLMHICYLISFIVISIALSNE